MPWLDSQALKRAEYDADERLLLLWFRDDEAPYGYRGVPEQVFDGLCEAQSHGQFFREHILDRYEFSPPP